LRFSNMFQEARIKLTTQYLAIIMLISLFFSLVIFLGINRELTRIEWTQELRRERTENFIPVFEEFRKNRERLGLSTPQFEIRPEETIEISSVRARILSVLGIINLTILGISGVAGYYLAGKTLEPIAKMVNQQKDFVSNASHELRTPLTSLKSEIEVALRDNKVTLKEAKSLLKSNLEEVDKMHKLSNYLIKLNRYQGETSGLTFSQVNLKAVAEEASQKVSQIAKTKNIKIEKNLKNAKIKGNEDSLVELATILLDNAIKYSSAGKKVIISTKKEGRSASLEVKDFGVGIEKQDIPHIFERFFRADTSRGKQKADGYGLGLSIAKSIAEIHNAKILVSSTPNKGSSFTVKFS